MLLGRVAKQNIIYLAWNKRTFVREYKFKATKQL